MPSIPIASPLSYIGVLFLIVGAFLIITGLDIVKVEKLTVTAGRRTLLAGVALAVLGAAFLLPDFLKAMRGAGEIVVPAAPPATSESSPAPTLPAEPTSTPQPTEAPAPTATSTPTPSSARTVIERMANSDATATTQAPVDSIPFDDVSLDSAMAWPLLAFDMFTKDSSPADWTSLIHYSIPVKASFDGRFNIEVPNGGGPVFAVFLHGQARFNERMIASITFDPNRQVGCDVGIVFAAEAAEQRYYQFITQNDQKSYAISYVDFSALDIEPVAPYGAFSANAPIRRLTVIGVEGAYRLFANDAVIAEFTDQRLRGGQIGIIGTCESEEPSRMSIDEFEVRGE